MNPPAVSPGPLTALLLDLDGTLSDSAPIILDAFTATLEDLGLPVPPRPQMMSLVGPPLSEGFEMVAHLTGEANEDAVARYRAHYREHMFEAPLYEGVVELLEALTAAGIPLAVATSKRADYATQVLEHLGIAHYFTVIAGAGAGDAQGRKADVIRQAIAGLETKGVSTAHVVHVGDRDHDVNGAREVGIPCIGVTWGYGDEEELSGAQWLVASPTELAQLATQLRSPRPPRSSLGRAHALLEERISQADARREAERSAAMQASLDGGDGAPTLAGEAAKSAGLTEGIPRWLVRGGIGAWLIVGLVIVVAMVFVGIAHIVPVFVGVFIALVITAILHPIQRVFARVLPSYPATFLALLSALAVVAGLVAYVVTSVTNQWASLANQFSSGVDTILTFIEDGPLPFHVSQAQVVDAVQGLSAQGQQYVERNATSLAGEVLSNAGTVVDVFVVLALAIFTAIFLLASGGKMWRWFLNELPTHLRSSVHRAACAGWYTFAGYARGTMILALTDAIMAGIFLQIVGVPLAAPLAVLVFIGAFIPMVGAPAAMIVAMIVALASKGVVAMIIVGLGVAGIGQIEGHILQPLIMGRQVSLHPVVVGIAVAVGSFAAGLLGAVIAVPLVSVAWSVYSEIHVKDAPVVGDLPSYR